jgi:hypothetical protein
VFAICELPHIPETHIARQVLSVTWLRRRFGTASCANIARDCAVNGIQRDPRFALQSV